MPAAAAAGAAGGSPAAAPASPAPATPAPPSPGQPPLGGGAGRMAGRKERRRLAAGRTAPRKEGRSKGDAMLVNTSVEKYACEMCDTGDDVDAVYFCVDCTQLQCATCCSRVHHAGTKNAFHSVERIMEVDLRGVHIITPIIDEVLLCIIAAMLWPWFSIRPDYLHTQMCPAVTNIRQFTSQVDTGLYTHVKSTLAEFCAHEDSFWRFFCDLWVRSTVTATDNWFVLVSGLPWALLGVFILVMLSPLVAAVYASVTALLHAVEMRLPPWPALRAAERCVAMVNMVTTYPVDVINFVTGKVRIDLLVELADGDMPPTTHPRLRPATDSLDRLQYSVNRRLRHWWYFYESTVSGITKSLLAIVLNTLILRFLAIWLGAGEMYLAVVRAVAAPLGVESLIERHQAWFGATGREAVNGFLVAAWNRSPLAAWDVPLCLLALLAAAVLVATAVDRYLESERESFRAAWHAAPGRGCECVEYAERWRRGGAGGAARAGAGRDEMEEASAAEASATPTTPAAFTPAPFVGRGAERGAAATGGSADGAMATAGPASPDARAASPLHRRASGLSPPAPVLPPITPPAPVAGAADSHSSPASDRGASHSTASASAARASALSEIKRREREAAERQRKIGARLSGGKSAHTSEKHATPTPKSEEATTPPHPSTMTPHRGHKPGCPALHTMNQSDWRDAGQEMSPRARAAASRHLPATPPTSATSDPDGSPRAGSPRGGYTECPACHGMITPTH